MRRWTIVAVAVAVLLIATLPALAVSLTRHDGSGASDAGPGWHRTHGGPPPGRHDGTGPKRHQLGPPPWAGHRPGAGPRSSWRALTPAQRAALMARLARRHADAMAAWAKCVDAGRTDCVRPRPPGLAKRGPARQGAAPRG